MSDVVVRLNSALEGRYRVERQLGEGGMATVYLASDLRHQRRVALKVLKPELAAVVGADRFLAEIRTTANLQHPHILPLFDSGQAETFLFYVMPYVEGESLRGRLDREQQLPVDEAVEIAKAVADALDYAHRHGVIHRDIKPANILLQEGQPVISDFGIALAVGAAGGGRLTETGLSLGTPHYMSPEQATGDQSVHAATDIYALGCVLYEMLVGEPPYTGSSAQAILGKIIQAKPVSTTEVRRSVPSHVDAVIRKALEKLAADRFTSARELREALGDATFRHGEAGNVGAVASRWNGARVAAVAVLASALTAGLVWSAAARGAPEPAPVVRFSIDLPGQGVLRGNTVQPIEITRDGRAVVVNALMAPPTQSQLFLRSLESLETVPLRGTENIGSSFLSPDGAFVAFVAVADFTFRRVALSGGPASTVAETGLTAGGVQGATWGEEGRIVYSTSATPGLMQVREVGGAPEPLTAPAEGEVHWSPHFVPGHELLLFEIRGGDRGPDAWEIAALDLGTGAYHTVTIGSYPHYVEGGYLVFLRGTTLWAARFDARRGALEGEPAPALEGVQGGSRFFSVSPGGTLVYAPLAEETGAPRTLVWVDRAGRETPVPVDRQPYVYPRLSPSGDRLAIAVPQDVQALNTDADLWVFDLARFSRSRITFGANNRFYPIWTPDGRRLTHADASTNQNRLLSSAADGTAGTDTLLALGDRRFPTSWSPDGRTLAYYVGPAGAPTNSRDVWLGHLEGDSVRRTPLVTTPAQDRGPVFSPDGRWIAYVSNKSGRDEVYVLPFPGPGPEYTLSTTGGREPVWSRDGTELFYRTDDQLMAVDVRLGSTFTAGQPRALFADTYERDGGGGGGIANYDVSPDGDQFLMVRRDAVTQGELVVVVNWVEELRRLLGS